MFLTYENNQCYNAYVSLRASSQEKYIFKYIHDTLHEKKWQEKNPISWEKNLTFFPLSMSK